MRTHFTGVAAALYPTYRAWAATARSCGPVTIYAQKTRIVFQTRVRFAAVMVRKRHLDTHLWLRRRVDHPRLLRTESFGSLGYAVHFSLASPHDIDDALVGHMREAYELARTGPHR